MNNYMMTPDRIGNYDSYMMTPDRLGEFSLENPFIIGGALGIAGAFAGNMVGKGEKKTLYTVLGALAGTVGYFIYKSTV